MAAIGGISGRTRFAVLERDNFTCQYCGRSAHDDNVKLEIDHLIPSSLGGSDRMSNLVTACHECNAGKSNKFVTKVQMAPRYCGVCANVARHVTYGFQDEETGHVYEDVYQCGIDGGFVEIFKANLTVAHIKDDGTADEFSCSCFERSWREEI